MVHITSDQHRQVIEQTKRNKRKFSRKKTRDHFYSRSQWLAQLEKDFQEGYSCQIDFVEDSQEIRKYEVLRSFPGTFEEIEGKSYVYLAVLLDTKGKLIGHLWFEDASFF